MERYAKRETRELSKEPTTRSKITFGEITVHVQLRIADEKRFIRPTRYAYLSFRYVKQRTIGTP
jgi:hypothetical protein